MKRVLYCFIVAVLLGNAATAQLSRTDSLKRILELTNKDTVAWVHGGMLNLGMNQGFLHNWPAGGELGSLTVNGFFSGFVTRFYHRHVWNNLLETNYSLFYAYSNQFVPRKLDDRIEFTSKYGVLLDTSKGFYLTGLLNFKSQFTKGFDYAVPEWDTFHTSRFFSPAYMTLAAGIEYRKGTNLQLFYSPIAARFTHADRYFTTQSLEGAFGVPYGENMRFELGSYFSGRYIVNLNSKVSYRTRLDLYSNYLAKNTVDSLGDLVKKDSPGNIDVLWDNLLACKVSNFLSVSLGATMIYDNDIPYEKTYMDESGVEVTKNEPGQSLGWDLKFSSPVK